MHLNIRRTEKTNPRFLFIYLFGFLFFFFKYSNQRMEIDYKLPLAKFCGYFLLLPVLLWKIGPQIQKSYRQNTVESRVLLGLSCVAFVSTWSYFGQFLVSNYTAWSNSKGFHWEFSINAVSHWLYSTDLLEIYGKESSVDSLQWVWTHQLNTFVATVWTPFLAIEGWKRCIPHVWVYMCLGHWMGISTASGLFFTVLAAYPRIRPGPSNKLLAFLGFSAVVGLSLVSIQPALASYGHSLSTLLGLSLSLGTGTLLVSFSEPKSQTIYDGTPKWIALAYSLSAGANLCLYLQVGLRAVLENPQALMMCMDRFFSQAAVRSMVQMDAMASSVISMVWMFSQAQGIWKRCLPRWVWALVLATPVLSASVSLPLFLAGCEAVRLRVVKRND
ncbi:hypothetical protein BY458DRAFT_515394 [Sporodiniella umbellata]|nr:hypothetical protein BY458DRAFT_515394 [Sporodiniella umbellata]